jgi:hypothetical protein
MWRLGSLRLAVIRGSVVEASILSAPARQRLTGVEVVYIFSSR